MRSGRLGVAVGSLALLLAVVATGMAWLALSRSTSAGRQTVATTVQPTQQSDHSSAGPSSTTSGSPTETLQGVSPSSSSGSPRETSLPTLAASYVVAYQDQALTAAATSNYGSRSLDLDEPSILTSGGNSDSDLSVDPDPQRPLLQFSGGQVAIADGDITPAGCADLIRRSPADRRIQASRDLTVCVVTNGAGGVGQATSPKMAILKVSSVDPDGSIHFGASAWTIPS